jgi:Ca2+-binding RTX toxin-like protein
MVFIVNPSDDNDTLHGAQGATLANLATITGTPFDDVLNGDGSANTIFGLGGNDTINAGGGADTVNGGSGDDHVIDTDFVNFDFYDGSDGVDTIDYRAPRKIPLAKSPRI